MQATETLALDDLSLKSVKEAMAEFNAKQAAAFSQLDDISELVLERSDFMDQLLTRLWHKFTDGMAKELSLVAVGGYGRGELHPKSDIDLLLLSAQPLCSEIEQQISAFITFLWDLRLEIGHSVRTIDDCIQLGLEDITIATNLIESRLIIGNETTFTTLKTRLHAPTFWPSTAFFSAKREEQRQRHLNYRDNGYSLEPDIKSNPGGLRDLHTLYWVARRHFGAANLLEMTIDNYLTQAEYRELLECQNFLWKIRFALHLVTNRADNRLLFDYQTDVATKLGYQGQGNAGIETMMKQFYRTIRRVAELNEMLLQHFDEDILGNAEIESVPIDDHFQLKGDLIVLVTAGEFFHRPESILQLFLHIADNPNIKGIYSTTLREIRESRRRLTYWLQDIPPCREKFMALLKHPRGMGLPLTLMHKYGVLAAYIPQWNKILGQMQFDLFHAYTVDEHTHRLIKYIYNFPTKESKVEHPICGDLFPTIKKPELLFLAAIFHDIAKGRKGDHSELGAIDAQAFCDLHGLSAHDGRLVAWLVKHHLVMSVTAQRRDIQDPDVITEFARVVQDEKYLNYLLLLTVADICATNDDVWNSWKGALLKELYYQTQKALRRGLEKPIDVRSRIRDHKQQALNKLLSKAFNSNAVETLWKRFKADYFLRHTPSQIAWHSEYILQHYEKDKPLVVISKRASRGGNEVFIYCKDSLDLFATVATELNNKNLNIHDATIMNSRDGYTLDTFIVLEPDGEPLAIDRTREIKPALEQALTHPEKVVARTQRLSRRKKQFSVATQVNFLSNKNHRTMMELIAYDSPGLLATIGDVFQKLDVVLHTAKITTIGEQVEDFFIVTTEDGHALNSEQQNELKQALVAALACDAHS
ncbi:MULTISPECIES: bifunctional uridylyltransferase/uridylyl-removing protein GlnD [unclassified Motilimonas]|uniref:bifunctional uridylyltransferase/uridylyl-removing protein GlnD n=1 Tax=unclassified Motilimonas TaxID=2643697 RepID=UPI001E59A28E|nr:MULTISPECIES: bifunctional uridylyltransferase/uridylyl-removing protein GlnD [unclassified Motilimonas]MCE0556280.1 bifunctional uridylyltransferase/uridylyl-removing protein GlnD [Motilimonas sp. E26]MDO6525020.1 bifunctional uridylyltransferase/uridylyl-removing protein GlnD [Motilimonas sp. 1_MG-2023]